MIAGLDRFVAHLIFPSRGRPSREGRPREEREPEHPHNPASDDPLDGGTPQREDGSDRGRSGQGLPRSVEELSRRERSILSLLLNRPGLTVAQIADTLGVSHSTARRYLGDLGDELLVLKKQEGRETRYYAFMIPEPGPMVWLRIAAKDPAQRCILDYLASKTESRMTLNRLAAETDTVHGLLVRTLRDLESQGLVDLVKDSSWSYVVAKPELSTYWEKIHVGQNQ